MRRWTEAELVILKARWGQGCALKVISHEVGHGVGSTSAKAMALGLERKRPRARNNDIEAGFRAMLRIPVTAEMRRLAGIEARRLGMSLASYLRFLIRADLKRIADEDAAAAAKAPLPQKERRRIRQAFETETFDKTPIPRAWTPPPVRKP